MVHGWTKGDSKKTCIKEKQKGGSIHQPFYGTWMLRQDAGKFMLGKYLRNKSFPWKRWRRLGIAVAGITPTASFLTRIGKMNQNRQDAISGVSAVQNSASGPSREHWWSGGWNIRSHQQCRLRRDGNDIYGCPQLHLQALVWQHAYCTKAKKQAQVCHDWQWKLHEHAMATTRVS